MAIKLDDKYIRKNAWSVGKNYEVMQLYIKLFSIRYWLSFGPCPVWYVCILSHCLFNERGITIYQYGSFYNLNKKKTIKTKNQK